MIPKQGPFVHSYANYTHQCIELWITVHPPNTLVNALGIDVGISISAKHIFQIFTEIFESAVYTKIGIMFQLLDDTFRQQKRILFPKIDCFSNQNKWISINGTNMDYCLGGMSLPSFVASNEERKRVSDECKRDKQTYRAMGI